MFRECGGLAAQSPPRMARTLTLIPSLEVLRCSLKIYRLT